MPAGFHSTIISASFRLGGFKIDVHLDDTLISRENSVGQCKFREQEIWLDPGIGSVVFAERFFLSQVVNWIFFVMGENELGNNARLVEGFAHLLYQALTTVEPMTSDEEAPDWDGFEEVDYDPGCDDDYDPNADAWELIQMEQEEEEESRREMESEMAGWSDYADSWARSDEEGWFYGDD